MRGQLLVRWALVLLLPTSLTLTTGCGGETRVSEAKQPRPAAPASSPVEPVDNGSSSPRAQVVRVEKYGVSFELPKGWMTLDAKQLLDSSNPVIKEIAGRMGVTSKQLLETIGSSVQTFSVTDQGAVDGFLDNVNSVGVPRANYNDEQLKLEIAALGAKIDTLEHASSAAGDITRVAYTWTPTGIRVHVVALKVDVGDAIVMVTASSHSAAEANERGDQIQASLQPIN